MKTMSAHAMCCQQSDAWHKHSQRELWKAEEDAVLVVVENPTPAPYAFTWIVEFEGSKYEGHCIGCGYAQLDAAAFLRRLRKLRKKMNKLLDSFDARRV